MDQIVADNTKFYYDVFRAEPDNHQTTFERILSDREELEKRTPKETLRLYEIEKENVRGHAVEYPVNFLINADIDSKISQLIKLIPSINFV